MLLLLLIYGVLRALWEIDVYLISTFVNKGLYYYYYYISKFSRLCNEFMSVSTMFPYNKSGKCNTSNTAINGLF